MKKAYISLFMILSIFFGLAQLIAVNAQATTMNIYPQSIEVSQFQLGSTLQINVTVQNVNNLNAWKASVNWNPNVLNLTKVKEGPFLTNEGSTLFLWSKEDYDALNNGTITEVSATLLSNSGATGSGTLLTLEFKLLSAQEAEINLVDTKLVEPGSENTQITHLTIKGIITAGTSSPNPTSTSTTSTSPSPSISTSPTSTSTSPVSSSTISPTPTLTTSSPIPTSSATISSSPSSNTSNDEKTSFDIYLIIGAGIIFAVIVIVAVFIQRRTKK